MRNNRLYTIMVFVLAITVFVGCESYDAEDMKFDNKVYLDVALRSDVQFMTYKKTLSQQQKKITALLAYPSEADVSVGVKVDPSLVSNYNRRHETTYPMLASSRYSLSKEQVVIPAGRTFSEAIDINFTDLDSDEMVEDQVYLLPVTITGASIDVLTGSSTVYYLVKRSSAITTAAKLTDNWMSFPTLDVSSATSQIYNGLKAVTYEAFIYIDEFKTTDGVDNVNVSSIMGVEQYMLLRIGDTNFERQQLQFDGGIYFGKFPKKDAKKIIQPQQWYHLASTYDMDSRTVSIYVNGELQSQISDVGPVYDGTNGINLAMRALYDLSVNNPGRYPEYENFDKAYQFFIGRSYDDKRPLNGKIAEARVWSVARTAQQIKADMYEIANPESAIGLLGYWKFNEAQGNIVKDYSGNGNDAIANSNLEWPDGIEIPMMNE